MLKRLVLIVFSVILVLSAVTHFLRTNTVKAILLHTDPSDSRENNRPQIQWKKNAQLVARRSDFAAVKKQITAGQLFLLKQHVGAEQECSYGLFRVNKVSEQSLLLTSLMRDVKSRLQIWADAQNKPVAWTWHPVEAQKVSVNPVQLCAEWVRPDDSIQWKLRRVDGLKVFISGSKYSEVLPAGTSHAFIRFDQFRHGWWVNPHGRASTAEILLRQAKTGALQKVQLVFQPIARRTKQNSSESKHRDLIKSFSLPGWD